MKRLFSSEDQPENNNKGGRKKGSLNKTTRLRRILTGEMGELARENILEILKNEKHVDHFQASRMVFEAIEKLEADKNKLTRAEVRKLNKVQILKDKVAIMNQLTRLHDLGQIDQEELNEMVDEVNKL